MERVSNGETYNFNFYDFSITEDFIPNEHELNYPSLEGLFVETDLPEYLQKSEVSVFDQKIPLPVTMIEQIDAYYTLQTPEFPVFDRKIPLPLTIIEQTDAYYTINLNVLSDSVFTGKLNIDNVHIHIPEDIMGREIHLFE